MHLPRPTTRAVSHLLWIPFLLIAGACTSRPPAAPAAEASDAAFEARKARLIPQVADHRLQKWREGYFTSNDPGKYLPGAAMARLLLDRSDSEAIRLMNDRRSTAEHYHFAAVNWARFIPLFKDVLEPETLERFCAKAANYAAYLDPGGTENHRVMSWTSAGVLPAFLDCETFGGRPADAALEVAKEQLRAYVKGLYAAGQGEWDSSTYLSFDLNGLLNLYDFSPDPEVRRMADAGLQWLVAAYALKYRDGMYAGPHFRGFTEGPAAEITDQTGWLWWGSRREPTDQQLRNFLYTMHAATSDWRPNTILDNIARKNVEGLPVSYTASKPNYWHGLELEPKAGASHEYVHLAETYTLGSLADRHGGQITRWELVAETDSGPQHFWGGHPRKSDHRRKKSGHGYKDGIGRYDQLAQQDGTLIHMTRAPDDEAVDWTFLAYPEGSFQQVQNGWYVFQAGSTTVAVYPLGESAALDTLELTRRAENGQREAYAQGVLKIRGRDNAFVLESGTDLNVPDLQTPELRTGDPLRVIYRNASGDRLSAKYQSSERSAALKVNDRLRTWPDQPIYNSPYVYAESGILRVSDGRDTYQIDFTGDLPVFSSQ
ncbi:MAG: hypothetical protein ACLFU4_07870 [Opitutales bacterium]